jgi:hypothetical protein
LRATAGREVAAASGKRLLRPIDLSPALTVESGGGGLGFSLNNTSAPGGPVVYLSANDAEGRLEFSIRNDSSAALSLTPDSRITLAMAGVLSVDMAKRVRVEGQDWNIPSVDGSSVTLAPRALQRLQPGDSTAVVLDHVLAAGEPRTRAIPIGYVKVDGTGDDSRRLMLFVHHPPQFNTQLPLLPGFDHRESYGGGDDPGDAVYTTPANSPDVPNILKLALTSRNPQQPIPLLPDSKPRVIVSCITGSGRAALCTDDQLSRVNCSPDQGDPNAPWTAEPQTENGVRTWVLIPPAQSDELFPESAPIVSFVFDTLVTTLEPGDTLMYIQCTGVPKFDDGFTALKIQKMAAVTMTANGAQLGAAATFKRGPVEIGWQCYAIPRACTLTIGGGAIDLTGMDPHAGTITYTPPKQVGGPIRGTLTVQGAVQVQKNFDLIFPPVINAFGPSRFVAGVPVALHWDCSGGTSCTVEGPGVNTSGLPISSHIDIANPPDTAFSVTLTCHGVAGDVTSRTSVALAGKFLTRVDRIVPPKTTAVVVQVTCIVSDNVTDLRSQLRSGGTSWDVGPLPDADYYYNDDTSFRVVYLVLLNAQGPYNLVPDGCTITGTCPSSDGPIRFSRDLSFSGK